MDRNRDDSVKQVSILKSLGRMIRRDWKTIPNMLSYFRLLLIPVFVFLYIDRNNYTLAAAIILVSGLTDIADGFIARHFNMVSDLGKALDPLADKLTQFAIFICLAERYRLIILFICVFAVKELMVAYLGIKVLKCTGTVNSAKWYGKITTLVTEAVALILVFVTDISLIIADVLILISLAFVLFSFVMYVRRYTVIIKESTDKGESAG